MLDSEYYDELEIRDPEERELQLFEAFCRHLAAARADAPYFAELFKGIGAGDVKTRRDLEKLPITHKSDLHELQKRKPPFAGMTTVATANLRRIYQSPGPTYDVEAAGKDWWGLGRSLYAAGVRPGDIVHNSFSYHLTPAAMMVEGGAEAIGCAVIPGGTGHTDQQAQAMAHIGATAYAGTPSFLKILLDRAGELGLDVSSVTKAIVGGEALPKALRDEFAARGVAALNCYASADLGLIAYESKAMQGLIVDERLIIEIVRPGTGEQLPAGEVGEVVVSSLNREYPLIRFATGDLSAVMPGVSPCGRTNMRLKGWMGRADQTTKVKGMFVHPAQVAEVVKRHPEIAKARLVVEQKDGHDVMTLHCETGDEGAALAESVAETLTAITGLAGAVRLMKPGGLTNDGKVIEDKRRLG
ncbi:MAG: phenylacetate--CoA ligase family protein [Rhodospirillales bacterium]